MNIWLITTGEPVPNDEKYAGRLLRTGHFSAFLAQAGHHVTWWASAFLHFKKSFIEADSPVLNIRPNLEIRLLRGCGYRSNISLARALDHRMVAKQFGVWARKTTKPDIILCSFPTIDLSAEAVRYGKEYDVPVVIDLRDMWPEIFVEHFPRLLRGIARIALAPLFTQARTALMAATSLTGITEEFLRWGLEKAERNRTRLDGCFPFAYNIVPPEERRLVEADNFLEEKGVRAGAGIFRVCFFGNLGRQLDIDTAIKASNILRMRGKVVQFVFCGTGDRAQEFIKLSSGNPDIVFPGWVDAAVIYTLLRRSSVGLAPLPDRYDFLATINNKVAEYLSAGVPIISCPSRGTLFEFLKQNNCGCSFEYGNATELADIIVDLIANPAKVKALSENATIAFNKNFTGERVNTNMMRHLELIANESNRKINPPGAPTSAGGFWPDKPRLASEVQERTGRLVKYLPLRAA